MARETTLEMAFDIPHGTRGTLHYRYWFAAQLPLLGVWGRDGRSVGIGFHWQTRTSLGNAELTRIFLRTVRAMKSAFFLCGDCAPYILFARVEYVRSGDGHGILTLKED